MSDFISRKALLKELKEYVECVYECDFEDTFCTAEGGSTNPKYVQGLWEAKEIIEGHPTAYDVDKVVERIYNLFPLQTTAGEFVSKNDVTNLVKGGGVDE